MNKQELIERIKGLKNLFCNKAEYIEIDAAIKLIEQLDEPQKTVGPQFVAGWLNYCKLTGVDLYHAFEIGDLYLGNYAYQKDYPKLKGYFETEENQELFARAWLDGYTVEEEKWYLVKMKGVTDQTRTLKRNIDIETWYFGNPTNYEDVNAHHTRKELEQAGFGWVFDCPGIEIEEVGE